MLHTIENFVKIASLALERIIYSKNYHIHEFWGLYIKKNKRRRIYFIFSEKKKKKLFYIKYLYLFYPKFSKFRFKYFQ
jgi:hypothetical protein